MSQKTIPYGRAEGEEGGLANRTRHPSKVKGAQTARMARKMNEIKRTMSSGSVNADGEPPAIYKDPQRTRQKCRLCADPKLDLWLQTKLNEGISLGDISKQINVPKSSLSNHNRNHAKQMTFHDNSIDLDEPVSIDRLYAQRFNEAISFHDRGLVLKDWLAYRATQPSPTPGVILPQEMSEIGPGHRRALLEGRAAYAGILGQTHREIVDGALEAALINQDDGALRRALLLKEHVRDESRKDEDPRDLGLPGDEDI